MKRFRGESITLAFTLAEVLITLAIIGIVAAMTVPTLILNGQKKEYAARLAQTYATLSQVVLRAQVDYGDIASWGYQSNSGQISGSQGSTEYYAVIKNFADKYFIPYMKISKKYDLIKLKDIGIDAYKTKDGRVYLAYDVRRYFVELNNGTILFFDYNGSTQEDGSYILSEPIIFVDVNGRKGPNIVGRDLYMFSLSVSKNKLVASGDGASRNYLKMNCKENASFPVYSGLNCTALIQIDGWKIAEDYPW